VGSLLWYCMETSGIRQPARHLAQIISLTIMGTLARSLQLHIKVVMENSCLACVSLVDVCSVVKICRIMVR